MVARNAPCPCGSGRKHKLCCGTTRAEESELVRRAEVVVEIAQLSLDFPALRPTGAAFSAWADDLAAGRLGEVTVQDGIERLEPRERRRIERTHAEEFPAAWRSYCDDLGGDEELARNAVVGGAVLAGIQERQEPDRDLLDLLEAEDDLRDDPAEMLALVLEPGDLWSVYESIQADEALMELPDELDDEAYAAGWDRVVEGQTARLRTRWHDERLKLLVARLGRQLPYAEYPRASTALLAACTSFERELAVRRRVAELLLIDSLSSTRVGLPQAA